MLADQATFSRHSAVQSRVVLADLGTFSRHSVVRLWVKQINPVTLNWGMTALNFARQVWSNLVDKIAFRSQCLKFQL